MLKDCFLCLSKCVKRNSHGTYLEARSKISHRTREVEKRLGAHGRLDCAFRRRKCLFLSLYHVFSCRETSAFIRRWFTGQFSLPFQQWVVR